MPTGLSVVSTASVVDQLQPSSVPADVVPLVSPGLLATATLFGGYGRYLLVARRVADSAVSKLRRRGTRSVRGVRSVYRGSRAGQVLGQQEPLTTPLFSFFGS